MAYFWFGFALVLLYAVIICYYYSKKRHQKVEKPKYNMMKDDEE